MTSKRYRIIVNPTSGSGTGGRSIPRIEQLLAKQGLDYDLVRTEERGHAIELAREGAAVGYDVIVAAGGDGTANEVLNGLMQAKKTAEAVTTNGSGSSNEVRNGIMQAKGSNQRIPAMGVLGVGRGNDFGSSMGVPADLESACRVLAEDHRRIIDVGRVIGGKYPEGRYFGNCVGVGFDAIGTIEVAKLPRLGGFLSYLVAVLKTVLLYYQAPLTTVEYDDQTLTQNSLMVSVMNGRRLGGGFIMAPDGEPDDGLFDLCIAREVSRARMFALIPHFFRGTQSTQEAITMGRAARVSITALEGTLPAQTDGEILCIDGQHLEIELLPRQLEIICAAVGEVK